LVICPRSVAGAQGKANKLLTVPRGLILNGRFGMRNSSSKSVVRSVFSFVVVSTVLAFILQGRPLAAAGEGAATFKAKCAVCHGPDGAGQTTMGKTLKVSDLSSAAVQKQSDSDLTATITNGKNKMPAFGKSLSGAQIKDVVGYLREIAKK